MKTPITPELLTSYFAGRATALQKQLINEWARDPQHQEQFYEALTQWEKQQPQYVPDVEAAMLRHQARMDAFRSLPETGTDEVPVMALPVRRYSRVWWVAASLTLLLLAGWAFRDMLQYRTYQTAYGQTQRLTLPDGSRVVMNANSQLRIPRLGFGRFSREVWLSGEAAFTVIHTPDHQPFWVRTGQSFSIQVLGTEFTVYTRRQGGRVVLNKGQVRLSYKDGSKDRQLLMKPGDLVTLDRQGLVRHQQVAQPETESAWQHNHYIFTNTSLSEISQLFIDNYGFRLEFSDPELANWTVSGSFPAASATELLEVLMDASSLSYTREANRIRIYKTTN